MTGLYLKETAKLFDIVDLTICCSLYKICNGNQFGDYPNLLIIGII